MVLAELEFERDPLRRAMRYLGKARHHLFLSIKNRWKIRNEVLP